MRTWVGGLVLVVAAAVGCSGAPSPSATSDLAQAEGEETGVGAAAMLVVDIDADALPDELTALRVFLTSVAGSPVTTTDGQLSVSLGREPSEATEHTLSVGLQRLRGHRGHQVAAADGSLRQLRQPADGTAHELFHHTQGPSFDPYGVVASLEQEISGDLTAPSQVRLVPQDVWSAVHDDGPGTGLVWVFAVHGRIRATHSMPHGAEVDDYTVRSGGPSTALWGGDLVLLVDRAVLGGPAVSELTRSTSSVPTWNG